MSDSWKVFNLIFPDNREVNVGYNTTNGMVRVRSKGLKAVQIDTGISSEHIDVTSISLQLDVLLENDGTYQEPKYEPMSDKEVKEVIKPIMNRLIRED